MNKQTNIGIDTHIQTSCAALLPAENHGLISHHAGNASLKKIGCVIWFGFVCYLPHGVKGQKVALVNLVLFLHVLKPGLEDLAEGVLEGNAEDNHGPPVVPVKVDTLSNLSSRNLVQAEIRDKFQTEVANGFSFIVMGVLGTLELKVTEKNTAPLPTSHARLKFSSARVVSTTSCVSMKRSLCVVICSRTLELAHAVTTSSMYLYEGKKTTIPSGTTADISTISLP
jgi:hypothetical protein